MGSTDNTGAPLKLDRDYLASPSNAGAYRLEPGDYDDAIVRESREGDGVPIVTSAVRHHQRMAGHEARVGAWLRERQMAKDKAAAGRVIPPAAYINFRGTPIVTHVQVRAVHSKAEYNRWCKWMEGQTTCYSGGAYASDYERWLEQGRGASQSPHDWD